MEEPEDQNLKENKEEKDEPKEESKPETEVKSEPKEAIEIKQGSEGKGEGKGKGKGNVTQKIRENPWIISTFVLGILVVIFLISNFSGGMTGKVISEKEAGELLVEYLNNIGDSEITLVNIEDDGNMYLATIDFEGQQIPVYVTKDGGYYTTNLVPIETESFLDIQSQNEQPQDILKSDKPLVELFIMTHCPYGTQAEKGIIPTIKALGNTIDAKIRFVHYFMHEPEETETPRQVCIREEQSNKFLDYLECFLEDGDSDRCLTEAGIDKTKMDDCVDSGRADEYYTEDSELSENYGVRGSPTLVINGEMVTSNRDTQSYLDTICSAFNDAPEECNAELSNASPSPMWGYEEGQDTGAQC